MTAVLHPAPSYTALLADAARAPSSHNTQPWLFRPGDGFIELHADRTRALPVNDPHDRELMISCGTAVTNLVVAAVHHHYVPTVETFPDPDDPDHVATVRLEPAPAYSDTRVAYGIHLRGTWRKPFTDRAVPEQVLAEMVAAAESEGAWVHVVTPDERPALVDLVARGDQIQYDAASWRRELAAWMHPRRAGDGLSVPHGPAAISRFVVSHVDLGERTARQDAEVTGSAPLVLVLGTTGDDVAAWLTAGRALQRLLLTGAVVGVQAGYSNQPCQVAELRSELEDLVGRGAPQMVLRLGYPPEQPTETSRRPVEDMLL
jgi:nitroreductase